MTEHETLIIVALVSALCGAIYPAIGAEEPPAMRPAVIVTVTGLRSRQGTVLAALFAGPDGFPEDSSKAFALARQQITSEMVQCRFENVPPGDYAVVVFHDENGNARLDKSFWGRPKEGIGASNNPSLRRRAPGYEESRFRTTEGAASVEIRIQY